MKIIPSSSRLHHVLRVSIFLITVALIAGMAGCGSAPDQCSGQCSLTIHCTEGGRFWEPGVGTTFNYDYGTVVYLYAEADICYEFVNWTGDVGTIADVDDPSTTIAMYGSYVITANFAPKVSENLEIWDWYDLDAVRDNQCGNYTLMNDLDSTTPGYEELAGPMANGGRGWEPISYEGGDEISFHFKGTFDGQGYEIHDLFINRPDRYWVGLFGLVDEGGIIKNVGLVRATVTGEESVGGLVGKNDGTVSNSYFSGNVTGDEYVGGLLGVNTGTVSNSYSTGSVTGDNGVGGLVGRSREYGGGTISSSYSTGRVTGDEFTGGLVGINTGTVSNSFWDTQTSGQSTSDGGTGKTTAQMKNIATFSGAGWNIFAVAYPSTRNPSYIWNIVDDVTYPFLSWQS
jgi:hypothetical protein